MTRRKAIAWSQAHLSYNITLLPPYRAYNFFLFFEHSGQILSRRTQKTPGMISTVLPLLSQQLAEHTLRSVFILIIGIPIAYVLFNELIRRAARVKGFGGPTNWLLVGNIPDIKYNAAEKYREWSKIYGDVYQIQLGNVPVIVVNSAESARKIFGQNSQALSSRPVFWTFHKVCTVGMSRRGTSLTMNRCFPTPLEPPSELRLSTSL